IAPWGTDRMNAVTRLALAAMLALPASVAMPAAPIEGRDYFRVNPPLPAADPSKIVVTKFFSYQCPHCDGFARPYAAWSAALPPDVKSERAAVSIGHAGWVAAGRAYYALVAMKAVPAIDDAFFDAVHRQRVKLTDEAAIAAWLARQGIDRAAFERLYRSFGVQLQATRADDLSRKVRLPSVPALVIDGRYLIPISDDGKFGDQLAVADALIERARRERPAVRAASPAI
ncbi:MAG: thiol:disulfide interchange protein DsbA/DsbL, partial [Planctomycetaceae bacterium]